MKKTAVIHVGSGKTGSTSIQNSLFREKDENDELIKYPLLLGNNNQKFRFAFCKLENTPSNVRAQYKGSKEGFEDFQNQIKKCFEAEIAGCDDVLISSEFLFLSSLKEIKNIRAYLAYLGFTEFKVLLYIREPSSYYLSVSQQALKTQGRLPQPNSFFYDFKRQIEWWESVFNDITVRAFRKDLLAYNDVVLDFRWVLEKYGYRLKLEPVRLNETISSEASQVMQDFHLGRFDGDNFLCTYNTKRKIVGRFIRLSSGIGSKPCLKGCVRKEISYRFNREIDWINGRFGFDFGCEDFSKHESVGEILEFRDIVCDFSTDIYESLKTLMLKIRSEEQI